MPGSTVPNGDVKVVEPEVGQHLDQLALAVCANEDRRLAFMKGLRLNEVVPPGTQQVLGPKLGNRPLQRRETS